MLRYLQRTRTSIHHSSAMLFPARMADTSRHIVLCKDISLHVVARPGLATVSRTGGLKAGGCMTTQRQDGPSPAPLSPVNSPSDQSAFPESHEREANALQQELAALRAAHEQELSALRKEMTAQIVLLRSALAAQQAQPVVASSPQDSLPQTPLSPDDDVEESGESTHTHANGTTSRRTLLKWGGVGAAAALAAAGGTALT